MDSVLEVMSLERTPSGAGTWVAEQFLVTVERSY
jgi:hypothetical protein